MIGPYSMDASQPTLPPDASPETIEAFQAAQQKQKVAQALLGQQTQPGAAPTQSPGMASASNPLAGVGQILQNPMMMQRLKQFMAQQQAAGGAQGLGYGSADPTMAGEGMPY